MPSHQLLRRGAVDLAEAVIDFQRRRHSWCTMFRMLQVKGLLLRNKQGQVTQNTWQTLCLWAIDHAIVEAPPPGMSQREAREIQQREAHELQQRAEIIQTLELTSQLNGGYVARVHTASGDQIEAQEWDGIGALIKLTQSLWYRYPGEQHQQDSDT